MMLMTMICILAVDFPVFPRDFGKCETWGTSLMDLGVGSFVFSLGIISALPMLRLPSQRFKPLRLQLLRDARRSLPLLLLGSIRVLMVKGVEYPEHVSEYGVHWNFFFTLALLPFFATLGRPLARRVRFATLGLALSLTHQGLLSFTQLGEWAASNSIVRITLLTQNKEGLASLPGYLALFLIGIDLGHYVLPRDPYLAYRRLTASRQREKTDKLVMLLVSFAFLWWGGFHLQTLLLGQQVSRRLANLPYVLWVAAYNTVFLLAYVTIYMVFLQPLDGRTLFRAATRTNKASAADETDSHGADHLGAAKVPALLQALNTHSFAIFLLANLLTGLVNVTMQTMYASNTIAVVVLLLYLAACLGYCLVAQAYGLRLRM
jgi:phosphatidylinositol glycan class W